MTDGPSRSQFYLKPWVICLMGGLLPFGSIFIEMYFIFTSFWNYKARLLIPPIHTHVPSCSLVTWPQPEDNRQEEAYL